MKSSRSRSLAPGARRAGGAGNLQKRAVVIGAGPYGLAVSSHLSSKGIETRCFGSPMAGWTNHMPKGMFLKSTAPATAIGSPVKGFTLGDYCDATGMERYDSGGREVPIPLADYVAYGMWFQQQNVPEVERDTVAKVVARGDAFLLTLASGESLEAGAVIVATGVAPFAYLPPGFQPRENKVAPEERRISHTCEHNDLAVFKDQNVAVIGAGQSAIESAVLLNEAGAQVQLLARAARLVWNPTPPERPRTRWEKARSPSSPLGASWSNYLFSRYAERFPLLPDAARLRIVETALGPAGAWWLRGRLTDAIKLHLGCSSLKAREDNHAVTIEFDNAAGAHQRLEVERVILATGYQVDLTRLDFLDDSVLSEINLIAGSPRLSPTFESSKRGLFFAGLSAAATFGPLMRFVAGTGFAARHVANGVEARIGTSP
jgi:FAD-dependent urate hydroxylase